VILLDVRFNRDDPAAIDRDILGEEQWKWFEQELRESDAQINIIGSGIQVLPRDKPIQEKWANFPRSLARLQTTLAQSYATLSVDVLRVLTGLHCWTPSGKAPLCC
jgi:alkaline phosphatase D